MNYSLAALALLVALQPPLKPADLAPQVSIGFCAEDLEKAKDAGFDYVEVGVRNFTNLTEIEFAGYLSRRDKASVKTPVAYVFLPNEMKIVGSKVDEAAALAYVQKGFTRARKLGVELIVFGSGPARSVPDGFPKEKAFDQLVGFAKKIAPLARKEGIVLGVEAQRPEETNIINSLAEALVWVEAVNHPNFQLIVDFYHLAEVKEDPKILLKTAGRIRHVHFANPTGRVFPQNADEYDYSGFFENLRKIAYRGRISIEARTTDLAADGPRAIAFLRSAMASGVAPPKVAAARPQRPVRGPNLPALFLIGDSTVRNGDASGSNGQWGWGEPLVNHFDASTIRVVNRAIGGRSSRTFLTEGRWDQVLAELKAGDFVLMQFGHNDGGDLFTGNRPRASLKGDGDETQEGVVEMTGKSEVVHTFGWYMRKYAREAKARGATPIVVSLVPRKIWKDGKVARGSEDYGRWAADAARAEGALFVDLNEIVARRYETLGPEKVEALFADERTHTNAAGAELNAAGLVAGLAGLTPNPLAGFLKAPGRMTAGATPALNYDVRSFGAKGDGRTLDTDAINKAIETAAAAGGGTVTFPAGTYLTFSIRLKSHISLYLGAGATLLAADPAKDGGTYDLPEPNEHDLYQDFGHSHWQNSLIWGIGVENVSILGPGRIDGKGLTRRGPGARWSRPSGDRPLSMGAAVGRPNDPEATAQRSMDGQGNKAIALKLSRNIVLRDFSMLNGGHFALLATGVDNLTIDNLMIDTNRDGLDIDASRGVHISNIKVNSPNDDAIVLKSSYALGFARATENVTITNCQVTGYDVGTLLDGAFKRTQQLAPDRDGVTGRIKFGTESNGGFKNITITNCVFDRSRGLALETVDGGDLEDITISNVVMRDLTTAPLFFRIGQRGRGPNEPPPGKIRRVSVSNVMASDVDPRFPALIAGLPGHPVEDLQLSNIQISYRGGGTAEDATREPPENATAYPEPSMFGTLPAYGFYIRHAKNVTLRDVTVRFMKDDLRPPFVLHDVAGAYFDHISAQRTRGVPFFTLKDVTGFMVRNTEGVPDAGRDRVEKDVIR